MPTAAVSAPGGGDFWGEIWARVCSAERVELKGITFWGLSAAIRDSAKLQSPKERSAPIWVYMQTNVLELSKELTPLSPSLFTAAGFHSRFWGHPGENKCQKGRGCPQQGQWPHCRDQFLYFQDQPHCCSPVRAVRGERCCRGSSCTTSCIIKTCARLDFFQPPHAPFSCFRCTLRLAKKSKPGLAARELAKAADGWWQQSRAGAGDARQGEQKNTKVLSLGQQMSGFFPLCCCNA